ncbi:MAG TPA: hypothetical protein VG778_07350, partial [Blastocatellia bacterium]|nr:hypothetical protein [Blastocatellia bacterium]
WMALAGVFTGIAVLFKQVAVLNLLFFVLFEVVSVLTARSSRNPEERGLIASGVFSSVARLAAVFAGFAAVAVVVVIWLASMGALSDFWRSVFEMGGVYIASLPFEAGVRFMVTRTGGFVLFNLALWLLVALAVVKALKATSTEGSQSSRERDNERSAHGIFSVDVSVAIWAAISLGGVFGGGRFFGHYFIQVLPALSLLGSRGVANLRERIGNPSQRALTRVAVAVLVVLFVFAFVRFHQRTAILAYETLSGSKTSLTDAWGMTRREREAEVIVARLKELGGAACPIYVWGYALDIYWLTGCRPASRYLMPYYISGQFPETGTVNPAHSDFWSETRSRFLEDLTRNRPPVILDVEGNLTALPSREILSFIERNYRREAEIGTEPHRPFVVYRLKADPNLSPHLSEHPAVRRSSDRSTRVIRAERRDPAGR